MDGSRVGPALDHDPPPNASWPRSRLMPPLSNVRIQTPRLVLRPLEPSDAPALFAIFSDPAVMRFWSTPPWASLADAHALIARDQAAMADDTYIRLGIAHRADDALIGHCTLFDLDAQCRRAELGYGLARSAWGNGYLQEAVTALLDFGFDQMGLNRVEADTDPRNAASVRSLDRLGFVREGLLRERWIVAGEVSDTALYGLLRRDWLARPPRQSGDSR